ncbi:MAG: helix-turn-helix domain-containing protein [Thermoproteales archaeon]|nr:helix-turn-helix domain-containing protein [Thermoproteales archaeon]
MPRKLDPERINKILKILEKPKTFEQLKKETGLSDATLYRYLTFLRKQGKIQKTNLGWIVATDVKKARISTLIDKLKKEYPDIMWERIFQSDDGKKILDIIDWMKNNVIPYVQRIPIAKQGYFKLMVDFLRKMDDSNYVIYALLFSKIFSDAYEGLEIVKEEGFKDLTKEEETLLKIWINAFDEVLSMFHFKDETIEVIDSIISDKISFLQKMFPFYEEAFISSLSPIPSIEVFYNFIKDVGGVRRSLGTKIPLTKKEKKRLKNILTEALKKLNNK